jgi:hypothetical protein
MSPGKDVGRDHVLDGVAVLDHRMLQLLFRAPGVRGALGVGQRVEGFLQVDVQRDHAALDVDVLEHDLHLPVAVAVADLELAGRELRISSISPGSKRSSGKPTSLYSSVSAMRPTRSCCFTSMYLPLICSRVVSFCGG